MMLNRKKTSWVTTAGLLALICAGFLSACGTPGGVSLEELARLVQSGQTAPESEDRVLIVDVRSSRDYLSGHISDALSAPLELFAPDGIPYYTNGWDELSATAATGVENSWLSRILINQLANDFTSTYADSRIIFYGGALDEAKAALQAAALAGFSDVSWVEGTYADWAAQRGQFIDRYAPGIVQVDEEEGSFVMTGHVAPANYANLSERASHHCVMYTGGGLAWNALLHVDTPPFCFQELLVYLGASPEGNMADGIFFGTMDVWESKYPDGQQIDFSVTWDGAGRYYALDEIFEERESEYHPAGTPFELLGLEMRLGGTRDSNLNFNPGCISCFYSCVCGITSNARANELTWFADGGIYDFENFPDDERNVYAGRYYPRADMLPGGGGAIQVKAAIVR